MPSYIFTTHSLQKLVQHTADPTALKHTRKIEIVSRKLEERNFDPENGLLRMDSENSLLRRRHVARAAWEADCQTGNGIGERVASTLLGTAITNLAALGYKVAISVTGSGSNRPHGAEALFRELGAFLNDKFVEGACGKVIVAILKASRVVDSPIESLGFSLHFGSFSLGADFAALQQGIAALGQPRLRAVKALQVRFEGDVDQEARDKWELLRTIVTAVPELRSLALTWANRKQAPENYDVTLRETHLVTCFNAQNLATLALINVYVTNDDLLAYLDLQRGSLHVLKLEKVLLQNCTGFRATLRWMAENLKLKKLELGDLSCMDRCETLGMNYPKVMCGEGEDGWWYSHGIYQDAGEVLDGQESLVADGKYFWKDQLEDDRAQKDQGIGGTMNVTDIPPYHSWLKFHEWRKEYGPLYRLDLAARTNIMVSSEEIANDLLRERGNIYSSREQLPMGAQLLSDNLRPVLLPYGDTWRRVRKLMHNLTNVSMAGSYEPLQEEESTRAVRDLIQAPRQYEKWFLRFSAGLILRLAYSKPVNTGDEEYVKRIMQVNHHLERIVSPGSYLVDTFPILMHLPSWLAPFKREGVRLHAEELDLFGTLLEEGTKASESQAEPNFCGKWSAERESYGLERDHVAYAIGTLFEAGAGTTQAAMQNFMLAMTLHPEEYRKMQQEVDDVVGPDRLPLLKDMPNLPRVRAIAKETMRWRPVTAGGLPHQLIKDDVYMLDGKKIFLEAGANIHPVQWSIHREPKRYPDPDSFRPERWLEADWPTYREPLSTYPNLQNFSVFGFGRRICPGQHVAERSLYILMARIAWCCDISQEVDANGRHVVPPEYDYVAGFNTHPKPFPFELKAQEDRLHVLETDHDT
ncbi:hypothetical protein B0A55_04707 [Friedmanniomyces simplex]|uniref:Cytochrome P450 n=1 Tax=Friedmanniomyces simplex TaxID=329884 RepID=A0A4U0XF50_9PEZI|nr:hypothetical protein B0A55_04707 [Friedmanniomyces simplex]